MMMPQTRKQRTFMNDLSDDFESLISTYNKNNFIQ